MKDNSYEKDFWSIINAPNRKRLEFLLETEEEYTFYMENYYNKKSQVFSMCKYREYKIKKLNISYEDFVEIYNNDRLRALQLLSQEPLGEGILKSLDKYLNNGDTLKDFYEVYTKQGYPIISRVLNLESSLSIRADWIKNKEYYQSLSGSWKILRYSAFAHYIDKRSFTRGSEISRELIKFFGIDDSELSEKKYIELNYDNRKYSAYFILENPADITVNLVWEENFMDLLKKKYPKYFHYIMFKNQDIDIKYRPLLQLIKRQEYFMVSVFAPHVEIEDKNNLIQFDEHNAQLIEQICNSKKDGKYKRLDRLTNANIRAERIEVIHTIYKRNVDVIVEVLERANGICERCNSPAPFIRASDGTPYLEVHHKIPLAEGGDDTVQNAIALCPNCHREIHFGTK